jgi:anti-sigma factor RsiW
MTDPLHPELELQDLLDDRLDARERARIQSHVDACDRCRSELDALRLARDSARRLPRLPLPADQRRDILDALARDGNLHPSRERRRRRWVVYGLAAAASLLVVAYLGVRDDLPAVAIRSATTSSGGTQTFDAVTSDYAALERFFAERLPFHPRVFDLAMMNYRLAGGRIGQIAAHPAAIYTYFGPGNRRLTCEMYTGRLDELPSPDERRSSKGISFLIYRRGSTTAVFWTEGDVICVAISDLPTDEVVALAFAKAVKS